MTVAEANARRAALDALVRVDGGAYAHIVVPELLRRSDLSARDRAFVTQLVYGTVRMRRALDHLLARVASRPIVSLDVEVRAALRMGAFQLYEGVAAHAAVGETVAVVPERARGFANGVLRSLARSGPPWNLPTGDDVASVATRTSHPDWIVQAFVDELGRDDALATLALDNEPAPVTLRLSPRADPTVVTAELRERGIEVEAGMLVPGSLVVRHTGDLVALPLLLEGVVTPQDQASIAVVAALDPKPGDRVLDIASAPGGKATGAADGMADRGLVVAADVHAGRVRQVARAAERLGLTSVAPVVADGRHLPCADSSFDRVLLDAPCSGLGVLRRRPDARWRVQPRDVTDLATLQRALLVEAARALRPGGRLVYSVCTLTGLETAGVDAFAQWELPDLVAMEPPFGAPWRPRGRGALLAPSSAGTDGMFVLVLERSQ